MATKKAAAKPADELDLFVKACADDPSQAVIALLWKFRHQLPDLAAQIDRKDLGGLKACADYLEVKPTLRIFRREDVPARAAQPPSAEYPKGLPGFAGAPASEHVTILVTDGGKNHDGFRPIENNEEDAQAAERAAALRQAKQLAPGLAQQVASQAAGGEFSKELVIEVCSYASMLARA